MSYCLTVWDGPKVENVIQAQEVIEQLEIQVFDQHQISPKLLILAEILLKKYPLDDGLENCVWCDDSLALENVTKNKNNVYGFGVNGLDRFDFDEWYRFCVESSLKLGLHVYDWHENFVFCEIQDLQRFYSGSRRRSSELNHTAADTFKNFLDNFKTRNS